jgi:putative colanic acid biosynthesis UDP-glucose lipid carrier transferase
MIKGKTRRYSGLISPLSYLIDIAIIIVVTQQFLALYLYKEFELKHFFTLSVLWIIISVFNKFYYIYRYTNFLKIINLLFNQIILFLLSLFCFAGIFADLKLEPALVFKLLMPISILLAFVKILSYYSIKTFRSYFGGNYRKTIIIGSSIESQNLELFFDRNKDAGYLHKKTFLNISKESILECINFVKDQKLMKYIALSKT